MSDRFADESDMVRGSHRPGVDEDPFGLTDVLVDQLMDADEDAALPAIYQPLLHVLAATRQPATDAELADELEAIARFRTQFATDGSPMVMPPARRRAAVSRCSSPPVLSVSSPPRVSPRPAATFPTPSSVWQPKCCPSSGSRCLTAAGPARSSRLINRLPTCMC